MEKVVLGIVETPAQAEASAQRLQIMGFAPSEVSYLYPDKRGSHDFGFERHTKAAEGGLAGAAIGAVIGAVIGVLLGTGNVDVPPALAGLAASGPVIAAFTVAGVFAAVLGVLGALMGLGIPEILAKHYEGKVRSGSILVAVHASDSAEVRRAREVLRSVAATNVTSTSEASIPASSRA